MKGYVEPEKAELRLREYETYNAYYCGLCKEAGENYGQLSRFALSNDMAFMALFLGAFADDPDEIAHQHCIIHPLVRKPVELKSQAIKYAADMMMILTGENFMDDVKDGERNSMAGRVLGIMKQYEKAANLHQAEAKAINEILQKLYAVEKSDKVDVNQMAAYMGEVMRIVFTSYTLPQDQIPQVGEFARNLGKWIYMIDALDDFEEDKARGRFNPMVAMGAKEREQVVTALKPSLEYYLNEMGKAFDLITFKKNGDIVKNVVFFGLRRRTEEVLSGKAKGKA
jgi:hypothetical protein